MTKQEITALKYLRQMLEMGPQQFSAGFQADRVVSVNAFEKGESVHPREFIVEKTRCWRESWILPVLDALINEPAAGRPPKSRYERSKILDFARPRAEASAVQAVPVRSSEPKFEALTQAEKDAIEIARAKLGRSWKRRLSDIWATGRYADEGFSSVVAGTLQSIRNSYGPTWLDLLAVPA